MEKYKNDLSVELDIFTQILNRSDVEFSKDVISAYDLYLLLESKLEELKDLHNNEALINEINNDRTFFNKLASLLNIESSISKRKCREIVFECDGNISLAFFIFNSHSDQASDNICIKKSVGENDFYFDKEEEEVFFERYKDQISEKMDKMEELSELFDFHVYPKITSYFKTQMIDDNYFNISINYFGNGEINLNIISCKPSYIVDALNEFLNENKEEILKKIPVNVSSLNPNCRTIVEDSLNKMNAPCFVKRNNYKRSGLKC